MRGTMLWFNEVKDVGLISTDEGERIHVAGEAFIDGARPQGRCAGIAVTYRLSEAEGEGEPQAREVAIVQETASRRARMRHGHR